MLILSRLLKKKRMERGNKLKRRSRRKKSVYIQKKIGNVYCGVIYRKREREETRVQKKNGYLINLVKDTSRKNSCERDTSLLFLLHTIVSMYNQYLT